MTATSINQTRENLLQWRHLANETLQTSDLQLCRTTLAFVLVVEPVLKRVLFLLFVS